MEIEVWRKEGKTLRLVSGHDLSLVAQTAALIRSCKVPEPYKGKGIVYSTETIKLKEGKKV